MLSRPFSLLRVLAVVLAGWGLLPVLGAADVPVSTLANSGPGSLRQAILDALPGDRIVFESQVRGTILLATPLVISKNLTLVGPGPQALGLSGGSGWVATSTVLPSSGTRLMEIAATATSVSVSGLRFEQGFASGSWVLGATPAASAAPETVENGGAIRMLGTGTLNLVQCWFDRNCVKTVRPGTGTTQLLVGGAIFLHQGTLNAEDCAFTENFAGAGSAICNYGGTLQLKNSTLSGNVSYAGGPAIQVALGKTTTLVHCTVSDNVSMNAHDSGGLSVVDGTLTLQNCLVARNSPGMNVNTSAAYSDLDLGWYFTQVGWGTFGTLPLVRSLDGNVLGNRASVALTAATPDGLTPRDKVGTSSDPVEGYLARLDRTATPAPVVPFLLWGGTSPALTPAFDRGGTAVLAADQVGFTRDAKVDAGAWEYPTFTLAGGVGKASLTLGVVTTSSVPPPEGAPVSDGAGSYTFRVPKAWTGRLNAPVLAGYTFTPAKIDFSNVTADATAQNFVPKLNPVTGLTANPIGTTGFTLGWTANPAAPSYGVEVALDPSFASLLHASAPAVPSAVVSLLNPNTLYRVRVRATDGLYPSDWTQGTVTTAKAPPVVQTGSASAVKTRSTTVAARVDAQNDATEVWIDYGTSVAYGSSVRLSDLPAAMGLVDVSTSLSGLTPDTPYHFRVRARNSALGATTFVEGSDATFTTEALKTPTLTVASSLPGGAVAGQDVTFTATVTGSAATPTGTVTLTDGTASSGALTLDGSGVATWSRTFPTAGTRTITASYDGDDVYDQGTGTFSQDVAKAPTTATVAVPVLPVSIGRRAALAAQVAVAAPGTFAPTGSVVFKAGTDVLGSASLDGAGQAALSLDTTGMAEGTHLITAEYSGDAASAGSTSAAGSLVLRIAPGALVVTSASDSGPGSLRQALEDVASGGTLTFGGDLTILLASGLTLDRPVTLEGTGHRVVLDGQSTLRPLTVTAAGVALQNLTIQHGLSAGNGGGLLNQGTLTLANCTFTANTGNVGGALANLGTLTATNCTFSANQAVVRGGGIENAPGGMLTLVSCTLYGNQGGGLSNGGTLGITHTVLAQSLGSDYASSGGLVSTNQYTLVGDGSLASTLTGDPKLGALSDQGGWTLTHAPAVDSPCVDAGLAGAPVPDLDQRGKARRGAPDLGAVEYWPPVPVVTQVKASADGLFNTGKPVVLQVTFDRAVTVTGTPTLALATGQATPGSAVYTSASGATLSFTYTVRAGDGTADLQYDGTGALAFNGGSIQDAQSLVADLTLPALGSAQSLAGSSAVVLDTAAPAAPVLASPTARAYASVPAVSGTAEPFAQVVVLLDGLAQAPVSADAGGQWTFTPGALAQGSHTVGATATDLAGNTGPGSASLTFTYDTLRPTPTVALAGSQPDPTKDVPVHFTLTFNEPVTGLDASGLTLGGTAPGTRSVVITGSGTTYDLAVGGMTGGGTVSVAVNADAAQDAATNGNTASVPASAHFVALPIAGSTSPVAGSVQSTTADVKAAVDPQGGSTSVVFEYATDPSFTGSATTGAVTLSAPGDASGALSGLAGNTTYHVRARATNLAGTATGAAGSLLTTPAAPAGLTATARSATELQLAWTVVPGLGYQADVATGADFATLVQSGVVLGSSPATLSGLTAGTPYFVRIRASNATGAGDPSAPQAVLMMPGKASGLSLGSVTASGFTAGWTATAGAASYLLDVATDSGFSTVVASLGPVTGTSRIVTGLSSATPYFVRVRAQNASGLGAFSDTATATTRVVVSGRAGTSTVSLAWTDGSAQSVVSAGDGAYTLDVPFLWSGTVTPSKAGYTFSPASRTYSALAADTPNQDFTPSLDAPTAPVFSAVTSTGFTASWTGHGAATGYRVDVSTDAGFSALVHTDLAATGTTLAVTGLSPNTTYYFRVRATDGTLTSAHVVSAGVLTTPAAPVALAADILSATAFTARWQAAAGATSYKLTVATTADFSGGFLLNYNPKVVSGLSDALSGLPRGTTFYYRLVATNASGDGPVSNTITVALIPGAPVATTATGVTSRGFTARWLASPGAAGYRLDVALDPAFTELLPGYGDLAVGDATFRVVKDLQPNQGYYYRVRATNPGGTSPDSNRIEVQTIARAPLAETLPATLVATDGATLQGRVTANNMDTTVRFELGTDLTFGTTLVAAPGSVSGTAPTPVSARATGLAPRTRYYVRVVATNAAGTTTGDAMSFTTPGASLTLRSVNPGTAPVGALVTLSGSGFTGTTSVVIGGMEAVFLVVSDTEILVAVPPGAVSGPVRVTSPSGTAEAPTPLIVKTEG